MRTDVLGSFLLIIIKDSGGHPHHDHDSPNYHSQEPRSYYNPTYNQPYTHYQITTVSTEWQRSEQFTPSTTPPPAETVNSTDLLSTNVEVQGTHQVSARVGYGTKKTHSMQSSHNSYNQHYNYYDSYYNQPYYYKTRSVYQGMSSHTRYSYQHSTKNPGPVRVFETNARETEAIITTTPRTEELSTRPMKVITTRSTINEGVGLDQGAESTRMVTQTSKEGINPSTALVTATTTRRYSSSSATPSSLAAHQLPESEQLDSLPTRGPIFSSTIPTGSTTTVDHGTSVNILNNSMLTSSNMSSFSSCSNAQCGPMATCTPLHSSFLCTCNTGYQGNPPSTPCTPIPLDHCSGSPCGDNTLCHNLLSGHLCQCLPGFFSSSHPTHSCQDVDECSFIPGLCGDNSTCTNTQGSYQCGCVEGYEGIPPTTPCTAVCLCGPNAKCERKGDIEVCTCREGYEGNPPTRPCQRASDCRAEKCGPNADCRATDQGVTCACKPGFQGDGYTGCYMPTVCKSPFECPKNETCKFGTCQCTAGFYSVSILCLDKDECSLNPDICGDNSHCLNIVGGYLCSCKEGYDRCPPLYDCTPASNCKEVCGDHSTCTWIEENQSFGCSCDVGFVEVMSGGCVQM